MHSLFAGHKVESARLQLVFIALNGAASLFISSILIRTTRLICYKDEGRAFLEQIRRTPMNPLVIRHWVILLFLLLLVSALLRNRYREWISNDLLTLSVLFDTALCIGVLSLLNLSNKEILLMPIISVILFVRGGKKKDDADSACHRPLYSS